LSFALVPTLQHAQNDTTPQPRREIQTLQSMDDNRCS
jgi:hypothetical protein